MKQNRFLFGVGGVAFGFLCGGTFFARKFLSSNKLKEIVNQEITEKFTTVLYGKENYEPKHPLTLGFAIFLATMSI